MLCGTTCHSNVQVTTVSVQKLKIIVQLMSIVSVMVLETV